MDTTQTEVIAAMSGGVDSAVAALLLKQAGYRVTGINLRLYQSDLYCESGSRSCCSPADLDDARTSARRLGIPFYALRMEEAFRREVIDLFIDDYRHGRTPNPCVPCNHAIKFGALLKRAGEFKIAHIATGHYARIQRQPIDAPGPGAGRLAIRSGIDRDKNQAYYLYGLSQKALASALFPLGHLTKSEVRQIARDAGLPIAEKSESQEICFVPDNDYRAFLRREGVDFTPGRLLHIDGTLLGEHNGREQFTIGQRRGLGIAHSEPLYVVSIESSGDVVVGERHHLECRRIEVAEINYQAWSEEEVASQLANHGGIECRIQVRYRGEPIKARLLPSAAATSRRLRVELAEATMPPAAGQSAVFYFDDGGGGEILLGGGIVTADNQA